MLSSRLFASCVAVGAAPMRARGLAGSASHKRLVACAASPATARTDGQRAGAHAVWSPAPAAAAPPRFFASRRSLIKRMMKESKATGREPRIMMSMPSVSMIISPYEEAAAADPRTWISAATSVAKNMMARYRIQKHMPSFKTRTLATEEAKPLYELYQSLLAKGDAAELSKITTQSYFSIIKGRVEEAAYKLAQAHAKVEAETSGVSVSVKAVRHAAVEANGSEFAQVTLLVKSTQRMDIFNSKGKRIGGTEGDGRTVQEYVVLERSITKPSAKWVICCVSDRMPPDPQLYTPLEGNEQPNTGGA